MDLKETSEKAAPEDRLPPHDERTEQSVIGALLSGDAASVTLCLERFGIEEGVFYDLKHETIWNTLKYLHGKSQPIDLVSAQAELKNRQMLDQVGGIEYLARCQDACPSAANIEYWLETLWTKYVARRTIRQNLDTARSLVENNGDLTESFVAVMEQRNDTFRKLIERGSVTPRHLCRANDFAEPYFNRWFNAQKDDEYGYELPFPFVMRVRPSEMTLMTGTDGSGKSTLLNQFYICCAKQMPPGKKIVIASMEMPPEITLWILARQLMGVEKLEDNDTNRQRVKEALTWINKWFLIYNFLGITDWRELLNTFRYAQKHEQAEIFGVDSVMRIGIQDDDYAQQGLAAAQFANFCVETGAHMFLVVHQNKGDGKAKDKVRGSKQWTDNSNNVCEVQRNTDKGQKQEELNQQMEAEEIKPEEYKKKSEELAVKPDSKFLLHKQRWPGSRQNGSKWLWFHHGSLQFHARPHQAPFNYLLD